MVAITSKLAAECSYKEEIVLDFSGTILESLTRINEIRKQTELTAKPVASLKRTNLVSCFFTTVTQKDINTMKCEYKNNGDADVDILFAFHAQTAESKRAFLSMLSGLLSDEENTQQSNEHMDQARKYTLTRLKTEKRKA